MVQTIVGDYDNNIILLYYVMIFPITGFIHSCNGQMELSAFRAYDIRVDHIHHMKQYNVLVTVGVGHDGDYNIVF